MKKIFFTPFIIFMTCCSFIANAAYQSDYFQKVEDSAAWLKEKTGASPELIIVLTAGVQGPEDILTDKQEVSSADIPYFPTARVKGHEGKLIFGNLDGHEVVLLKGRYHYYEGLAAHDVVLPYFVLNKMGAKSVITVNAVGGIRYDLEAGDIMMITDHINGMYHNSLRGIAIQQPDHQFTDMTDAYYREYREIAKEEAEKLQTPLKEGIYLSTPGPNYETKAEIKMFRNWGVDAIGMSTVLEVIACNFLEMKVLSFSCITNPAADRVAEGTMSHEEVLESLEAAGPKISSLVTACAKQIINNEEQPTTTS